MAWTKRALVERAYEEIGLSAALGYTLTAEQMSVGLARLGSLMATLDQQGYNLAYNAPSAFKGDDLDDDAGIPPYAHDAVYLSLAIRLAPTIGKAISMETRQAHREAMNALAIDNACPPVVQRDADAAPAGQGNRSRRWPRDPFLDPAYADPLSAGQPDKLGEY